MKKTLAILLAALTAVMLLAGCGASSGKSTSQSAAAYDGGYYYDDADFAMAEPMEMMAEEAYWAPEAPAAAELSSSTASSSGTAETPPDYNGVKLIYTAWVEMESTDFDAAAASIAQLTAECGGYFESSSMSDRGSSRSASYTVRVPADKYRTFLDKAGTLCHVTYQEESSQDVSETYYDTAGRLETQKTKLTRLQELLAEANHMDDIIVLENEISDTEEAIDRLSGTLRRYDALVSYSTVTVSLREVKVLTEVPEVTETFGQRLGSAFRTGLRSFGEALGDIMVALAYSWLWLVLIAAIVVVILLLTKKKRLARREQKKNAPPVTVPTYTRPDTREEKEE